MSDGSQHTYAGLEDAIKSVDRRLDIMGEESRTRFDLLTEKVVAGIAAITNQIAVLALDVGQLMQERVDNRRRLDSAERRLDGNDERIDDLKREQADIRVLVEKLNRSAANRRSASAPPPTSHIVKRRKAGKKQS